MDHGQFHRNQRCGVQGGRIVSRFMSRTRLVAITGFVEGPGSASSGDFQVAPQSPRGLEAGIRGSAGPAHRNLFGTRQGWVRVCGLFRDTCRRSLSNRFYAVVAVALALAVPRSHGHELFELRVAYRQNAFDTALR